MVKEPLNSVTGEWVKQAQQGNRTAFNNIYIRYANRLTLFILYRMQIEGLEHYYKGPEDVCQETFVRAYQKLDAYEECDLEGGDSFYSWLCKIAINIIRDLKKEISAQKRPPERMKISLDKPVGVGNEESKKKTLQDYAASEASSADAEILVRERSKVLREYISKLRPLYGEVMLLDLEGFSTAQIAQKLSRSPESVRQQRYRGTNNLKKIIMSDAKAREYFELG